ncbi:DNA-binding protein [Actinoplanes sp. Pm04-4]|jgi:prophage regulatory protein|uniref:DNA-binding protein n=1 Tax=Paractinoplanes pyxinae TaxID=2997416 RepID=A0ABT4B368_9ACTN|nr:DNA-binding protein [Actinoplanes pyxinae]MCY1140943.1 DNA-binding protein [Actinoplanes pyxinae]
MEKVVLMGAGEIRRRLGVSRQRVQQIITRKDFPDPYQELEMGKVWDARDVEVWIAAYRPRLNPEDGL